MPEPVRVSLWKLIDSEDESSDEEGKKEKKDVEEEKKEQEQEKKEGQEKTENEEEMNEETKIAEEEKSESNLDNKDKKEDEIEKHLDTDMVEKDKEVLVTNGQEKVNENLNTEANNTQTDQSAVEDRMDTEVKSTEEKDTAENESERTEESMEDTEVEKNLDGEKVEEKKEEVNYGNELEKVIASVKSDSGRSSPVVMEESESKKVEHGEEKTVESKEKGVKDSPVKDMKEVDQQSKDKESYDKDDKKRDTDKSQTDKKMLPSDKDLQEEVLCAITGRVILEGESAPEESIVIPPSPPTPTPLTPIVVKEKEQQDPSKAKPELLCKKWAQRFEYTPTQEKIYRCTFNRCGQCFDTKKAAVLHNKSHGAFGRENSLHLSCWECEYQTTFSKWYDMLRHLRSKHDVVISHDPLSCMFCGLAFATEEALSYHINFHYLGKYKCVHCGALCLTWKQIEMHKRDCAEAVAKKEKKLGCPYCSFVFHIRNMRNIHMLSHTDDGLVCIFCGNNELWENWKQLRKHYQQKHGRKVTSAMNPLKPTKMEIKKNPSCHVCQNEFKVYEDFVYHMRKVHDFVPYVSLDCPYCEKMFRTQKAHEWHMKNTHGDDIRCEKCDYLATSKQLMRTHMKKHEDKQHECNECGKAFAYYNQLRVHMVQHARKAMYPCKVCDDEFSKHADLRQHMRTDHAKGATTNKCPECAFSCNSKANLAAHIKRHHPEYDDATIGNEEPSDKEDPEYQPALHIPMSPSPNPKSRHAPPPPPPAETFAYPAPPPAQQQFKPKGRRTYYKGGRRGRGRGRGRGGGVGRGSSGGGKGEKSLQYLQKTLERRVGRKAPDMPEIGIELSQIPELVSGGAMDRDDKKKIKRLLKIKEARIKYQQKVCCARSISYQDHMAMKALDSSTSFSPIANFELSGEPGIKRRRMSSTSSASTPYYAQQSSYQSTFSPYEPSVRVPTEVPESYDLLKYPFLDHCYFKMEGLVTGGSGGGGGVVDQRYTAASASSSGGGDQHTVTDHTMSHGAEGEQDWESRNDPRGTMRGVYRPTSWGSAETMKSYAEEIDVGNFDESPSSAGVELFPSTSFVPPPLPPTPRRSEPGVRRKRGRKPGSTNRRPYGSGQFVPLAPQQDYLTGISDNVTVVQNSDTVPLDQFSSHGEVAMQHEVVEDVVEMGEEVIGGPGVDLMKPPAAEDLMEDIPQDSLLKDIITQLEHRTAQQQASGVPQSPMTSALMRTLMQSPPGAKISGRRLSLGGGNNNSGGGDLLNMASNMASIYDGESSEQDSMQDDCMVKVMTSQNTMPSGSIASVLPASTPTSAPSYVDESTLNEVYQLLDSKFQNFEDLQEQIGQPKASTVTTASITTNQSSGATTPEVIYTAKPQFVPGPGSTARYRTLARANTSTSASTSQSSPVIYQSAGAKTSRISTSNVQGSQLFTIQSSANQIQSQVSPAVNQISVSNAVPISQSITFVSSQSSISSPITVTTSAQSSVQSSASGRIPVRIQLGSGTGAGSQPMRIRLPSGTSLGQNITRISLQQLLKSGASIQGGSGSGEPGKTRIIRVPASSLGQNVGISSASGPRVVTISGASSTATGNTPTTYKIAGNNIVPVSSVAGGQLPSGTRVIRVSRGGAAGANATNFQIKSDPKPQGEIVTMSNNIATIDNTAAIADTSDSTVVVENPPVEEPVQDELMDSLPTDEEIANNIRAGELEDGETLESDLHL